jgi:hypothetical protein
MANHLTPDELADALGMDRRDVLRDCVQLGVPVFNGRIDRTLFCAALHRRDTDPAGAPPAQPEDEDLQPALVPRRFVRDRSALSL